MASWSSPMSFTSFLLFPSGEMRFLYAFWMPLSWTISCSLNCSCSAFLKVLMGHFRMKRYSTSAINSRAISVSVAWVFNRVPILSISMSCLSIRSSGNVRVSALRPAVFGCSPAAYLFLPRPCLHLLLLPIPQESFPQWLSVAS